ncbi:hypothetical protein DL93DRAFT_776724 [Clavulina sp. PMI_390]|nr:hypothetical protein DL93DRAFT_776724 [Clavulina sp. PMI_390]
MSFPTSGSINRQCKQCESTWTYDKIFYRLTLDALAQQNAGDRLPVSEIASNKTELARARVRGLMKAFWGAYDPQGSYVTKSCQTMFTERMLAFTMDEEGRADIIGVFRDPTTSDRRGVPYVPNPYGADAEPASYLHWRLWRAFQNLPQPRSPGKPPSLSDLERDYSAVVELCFLGLGQKYAGAYVILLSTYFRIVRPKVLFGWGAIVWYMLTNDFFNVPETRAFREFLANMNADTIQRAVEGIMENQAFAEKLSQFPFQSECDEFIFPFAGKTTVIRLGPSLYTIAACLVHPAAWKRSASISMVGEKFSYWTTMKVWVFSRRFRALLPKDQTSTESQRISFEQELASVGLEQLIDTHRVKVALASDEAAVVRRLREKDVPLASVKMG